MRVPALLRVALIVGAVTTACATVPRAPETPSDDAPLHATNGRDSYGGGRSLDIESTGWQGPGARRVDRRDVRCTLFAEREFSWRDRVCC